MTFNQFEFLLIFLPLVLLAYYTLDPRTRIWQIIIGSAVFYSMSSVGHLILLGIDILWVYVCCTGKRFTKFRLVLAISLPLLLLVRYKYLDFFFSLVGIEWNHGKEILPAGISFFTFELISYAVDRYRGHVSRTDLKSLCVYTLFFPHLVAGPIIRFDQVEESIAKQSQFRPTFHSISSALAYLSFGMGLKVLIADSLHETYQPFIDTQLGTMGPVAALYIVFAYSFQIFFDFYGYSLMAIGLGRFFGFNLPQNFDRPYSALSPKDFWRRWHMSLSFWIRDYLYFPLGGNKAYIRNIMITFAICGLWHGAGLNFIVWGLYHGVLVAGFSRVKGLYNRLPVFFQIAFNFVLVSMGWILFLFNGDQAPVFVRNFFSTDFSLPPQLYHIYPWLLLILAGTVCWGARIEHWIEKDWSLSVWGIVYSIQLPVWLFLAMMRLQTSPVFIYFRF